MYAIVNTFAGTRYPDRTARGPVVSRHRKLTRAIEAVAKFNRDVKRANGRNAYIHTEIITIEKEYERDAYGPIVSDRDLYETKLALLTD